MGAGAWRDLLEAWDEHARASGLAVSTREHRRGYVALVAQVIAAPSEATTERLWAVLGDLAVARRWSSASESAARGAVRAFYAWAFTAGHVADDPARALVLPPAPPKDPADQLEDGGPWRALLDAWDEHARRAGFAATTRAQRRRHLADVAQAIADPQDATTERLREVLDDLAAGRRGGRASADNARGAVRAFYAWAFTAGHLPSDPARHLTGQQGEGGPRPECAAEQDDGRRGPAADPAPPLPEAWARAIDEWSTWWAASGRSAATLRMRRHYLGHLAVHVGPDPWAATTAQLLEFMGTTRWRPETRKSARGAVRAFYAWARAAGYVAEDPARVLPSVPVAPGVPRPAPPEVIRHAREQATPRERLMIDLAERAGLRREEVARVHTDDLEGDLLRVHGKGRKERLVPLDPALLAQLRALPRGWVFPRRQDPSRPVSAGAVGKTLTTLLGPGWSGHTLRHAAGSAWYALTGDLPAVSRLLGHAKVETTMIYTRVPDDRLRAVVAARAAVG